MTHFVFDSKIKTIGAMPNFTQDIVKNETMFYNASRDFVRTLKSDPNTKITQAFLDAVDSYLLKEYKHIPPYVIDSRVHMLFKGWYAAIPGWHHDDVARTLSSGQPNYYKMPYKAQHIMALVNGDICPTQFALGRTIMPDIEKGEMYYKKWHPIVEDFCNNGMLKRYDAEGNAIIRFDYETFHQGQETRKDGWRWFGRVSWDTDRVNNMTNEIRRQVNCYLPAPMEGW